MEISKNIIYIGVNDRQLDLFEGMYEVPNGMAYNSYVILDEKCAVMDTVDKRKMKEWESLLLAELNGRKVDYLVVHHVEPDHAGCIQRLMDLFPEMVLVGNQKTFLYLPQFFTADMEKRKLVVKEGDVLFKIDDEAAQLQMKNANATYASAKAGVTVQSDGTRDLQNYQTEEQIRQIQKNLNRKLY